MNQEVSVLDQIIEEGNEIDGFLQSAAWGIIQRTAKAQLENYRADCYEAAKDSTKNLANYLGRMEGIEWLLETVRTSFTDARARALQQKQLILNQAKESAEIDQGITSEFATPMFHKAGTI